MILSSASPVSLVLGIATVAAYALQAAAASRLNQKFARGTLFVAWLLHGLTLAWSMLGDTPRFGFAPALSTFSTWCLYLIGLHRENWFRSVESNHARHAYETRRDSSPLRGL